LPRRDQVVEDGRIAEALVHLADPGDRCRLRVWSDELPDVKERQRAIEVRVRGGSLLDVAGGDGGVAGARH
jgi:hypothetical protein